MPAYRTSFVSIWRSLGDAVLIYSPLRYANSFTTEVLKGGLYTRKVELPSIRKYYLYDVTLCIFSHAVSYTPLWGVNTANVLVLFILIRQLLNQLVVPRFSSGIDNGSTVNPYNVRGIREVRRRHYFLRLSSPGATSS